MADKKIESKEKLNIIRNHLFSELCWRLDHDEQFRIKFGFIGKTNEDVLRYINGEYGIDKIQEDLDKLEKQDKVIEILKEFIILSDNGECDDPFFKQYDISVKKQYVSNRSSLILTKEKYNLLKEVLDERQ